MCVANADWWGWEPMVCISGCNFVENSGNNQEH